MLLFSGYLNPTVVSAERHIYGLSIPNQEVKYIYETRVLQWVTDQLNIDSSKYYSFVHLLPAGHIETFKEQLQTLLYRATSFFQTGSTKAELFYSGFMLGMLHMLCADYSIESERETGSGRADMLLIPQVGRNDNALIIEYKTTKTLENLDAVAQAGLAQIIAKQYHTKVKTYPHVRKITSIALAFCGKEVTLAYRVDEVNAYRE
ncbi:PD-(D/E)XK nuclease domain-containing protein [Candidatus Cardinium hertigii]|uniref:PD-(D/E)XK nuclease domain-containing protein n=1 Tax=Candidatus Cardinium hertigii TaxID=247481 RepID=UPI000F4BA343|nr:PD-(D/E)XK nuclease domain-containing protein [Candidatus Cardinium hertigii]